MSSNKPVFKSINSIGIVVKDIDKTVKSYVDKFGIGPFKIYEWHQSIHERSMVRKAYLGISYNRRSPEAYSGAKQY